MKKRLMPHIQPRILTVGLAVALLIAICGSCATGRLAQWANSEVSGPGSPAEENVQLEGGDPDGTRPSSVPIVGIRFGDISTGKQIGAAILLLPALAFDIITFVPQLVAYCLMDKESRDYWW
jgi:hypothetical protein